jgi:histidinol phosphatase-like enzyme
VTAAAPIDRDGAVFIDKIYLTDPKDIEFAPFAIECLRLLRDTGGRPILLTNHSGIARGYFSEENEMLAAAARGVKSVRVAPDFVMAARRAIDYFLERQTKRRPCM